MLPNYKLDIYLGEYAYWSCLLKMFIVTLPLGKLPNIQLHHLSKKLQLEWIHLLGKKMKVARIASQQFVGLINPTHH